MCVCRFTPDLKEELLDIWKNGLLVRQSVSESGEDFLFIVIFRN